MGGGGFQNLGTVHWINYDGFPNSILLTTLLKSSDVSTSEISCTKFFSAFVLASSISDSSVFLAFSSLFPTVSATKAKRANSPQNKQTKNSFLE